MSAEQVIEFERGVERVSSPQLAKPTLSGRLRKPPQRATIAPENKILVSREEAAQLLSISRRTLDYLVANRRLPTRRIGGRVLIPVADLQKYARNDHAERIVS
jgi:excisionase family DNA binding protein